MSGDNICVYMAHVRFYVCGIGCVGVCWNVCCVTAVVEDRDLALEWCSMLYVCVGDVMDVVFYVCSVTRGAVGVRVWEV